MADMIDINVDISQFDAMLSALPEKIQKQYLKGALQAAGDVILASMVSLAPERTDETTPEGDSLPPGVLKEDLHTTVVVGASTGARVKVGPSEIAAHVCRWQNDGWTLTAHGKNRGSRKKIKDIPGKLFMEGAIDASGEDAVNAFADSLAESLETDSDGSTLEEETL